MSTTNALLPPETTDRIIDFLYDSPGTLAACALVHSSWRPRAQWVLFARILLRDHRAYMSLRYGLLHRIPPRSPELCRRAMHLEITDDAAHPYAHEAILAFPGYLPAVQSFVIHNGRWARRTRLHPATFAALPSFSHVVTLELHSCHFLGFADFVRFISSMKHLHDLTLIRSDLGVASPTTIAHIVAAAKVRTRLRRVRAEYLGSEGTCVPALLTLLTASQVHDLTVITHALQFGAAFHPSFENLLHSIGPALTKLDAPVFLHDMDGAPDSGYGLDKNTQLHTLILRHTFREYWVLSWIKIAHMLGSILSTALQSIAFVFTILFATVTDSPGAPDSTALAAVWGLINVVLSGESFRRLQSARVTLDWRITGTVSPGVLQRLQRETEAEMRELIWYKRGIMVIDQVEEPLVIPLHAPTPGEPAAVPRKEGTTWDDVWARIAAAQ